MAEKITVNVPHKLTRDGAKSRIESGFSKVQEQIAGKSVDVQQSWNGDVLTFSAGAMGQKITGTLTVQDENVLIEVDLPWILAKLSGGIQDKLKKGTQLLLDKK